MAFNTLTDLIVYLFTLQLLFHLTLLFFFFLLSLLPSPLSFSLSLYLSLSPGCPDINLNSPNKGLVVDHSDSLADVPVEGAVGNAANPLPPGLTEEEAEELRTELTKVGTRCSTVTRCLHASCSGHVCFMVAVVWYICSEIRAPCGNHLT